MFWGLVLEPAKKYTQTVARSFHISKAVLELNSADNEPVEVIINVDGSDFIAANLLKKNASQVTLDLNFQAGDTVSFRTFGKGRVHLTGYHVPEDEFGPSFLDEDDTSADEISLPSSKRKKTMSNEKKKRTKLDTSDDIGTTFDDMGDSTLMDLMSEEEEDEDEDDSEDESDEDEEEVDEDEGEEESSNDSDSSENETETSLDTSKEKKSAQKGTLINGQAKKGKKEIQNAGKSGSTPKKELNASKQEGKASKQTPKKEAKSPAQSPKSPTGQKKVFEGGVIVEELKGGDGPVAKPGRMAQVYYTGRLKSNNKVFDQTTSGAGFKFRLGRGEVIKGWDIGVSGMKIGSKRRITIPPALAYGSRGSPPVIPPNSTLVFEVELKGLS